MPLSTFEQNQFTGLVIQRGTASASGSLTELTNGHVDLEGTIRSRSGAQRINVGQLTDGSSTNVHSHMLYGNQRYTGVGTVLKRGFEPGDPSIITGLNGKRIQSVHMSPSVAATNKQFTYFANGQSACRKKDDGTTTFNWGLDGPVASEIVAITPTVNVASQPATTAIDSFAAAYTAQDGFGTEGPATSPYDTSARAFTVPATKNERFRRSGVTTPNLSGSGEDAFIRIMLRVDNRQNLDHVEVALSGDTATFTTNFYTFRIAALDFQEDNSWQEFKIPKNTFERVKPTGGSASTWAAIDGVQITVGANSKGQVVVSADDARMEADTHADGTYDYKITLWNDTLKIRSNGRRLADIYSASPYVTRQVTVHRQRITVARPTGFAAWDVQASHWEMWRRNVTVGDGKWHFIARATVATATMDDDLNELGVGEALLEINHIPPPAKFILGPYDNRCFFFGMTNVTTGSGEEEAAYSFRWSETGYPESVPFTNYGLAGDPTDTIQGGGIWAGNMYLWSKARVFEVSGRQGAYVAIPTEAPEGTLSPYTISPSPHGLFYRALDGIRLYGGGTSVNISLEIAPIFRGETITLDGLTIYPLDGSTVAKSEDIVGTFFDDRYVFAYTDTNNVRTTLFYHIPTKRWHRAQNTTANSGWNIQSLSWERVSGSSPVDNLEGGSSDGWLMLLDSSANNPGLFVDGGSAAIPFAVQLKAWDAELKPTEVETDLKDIVVDVDTGNQTLTVQASFDGAAYTTIGTVLTTSRDKVFLPINGGVGTIAFRTAVRITGSLTTARVTLWSVGTQHIPEPKRFVKLSTDYDTQGWPGEKYLQELTMTANTFGVNVIVTVEADGVDLAQTFTLNTATRKPQVFSFNIENPLVTSLRLKLNGTAEAKLYDYHFQFLKEPLRITKLETEVSTEEWPGPKILQELQVTANTYGGNVTVVVEVDGVDLAQTFTLNTLANRDQVFSFSIEEPRATNLRLKMTGAAVWKYYRHQFQYLKEPLTITIIETEISTEGWPGPKILQELQVTANTHGVNVTVVVEVDGVDLAQTFTLNTTVHKNNFFSFNIEEPRGTYLRLKMTGTAPWTYYDYKFQFLQEPWDIIKIETEISTEDWVGPKIFQELQIEANTHGTTVSVIVELDGADLPQIFILNTTANRSQVFSFVVPHPRGTKIRLKMSGTAFWTYYRYQTQYLKEPLLITKIETIVSIEGWPGPKIFRACEIEIDTRSANVRSDILLDGTIVQTDTLNTSVHTTETVTMVTSPEGRAIVLRLVGAQVFAYYGHSFVGTVNLPETITVFDSTRVQLFGGKLGWLGPRATFVTKGPAAITVRLYMDNVLKATLSIPAQSDRGAVLAMVPVGIAGKVGQVKLSSTAEFQLFPEGTYIEAHSYDIDREAQPWNFTKAA